MRILPKFSLRVALILAAWVSAVVAGILLMTLYEASPGKNGAAPATWPETSSHLRATNTPTLLMFLHPQCPCSRATLTELIEVLTRSGDSVRCVVAFIKPPGGSENWAKSELWERASGIPQLTTLVDEDGILAKQFAAETSGQALLYSAHGKLLFAGGITSSRGQTGDNAGRQQLLSLIQNSSSRSSPTSVFGCPLFTPGDSN
jgi:hypothetical protein